MPITQRIIKNRKKVGMFISYVEQDKVYIGYSLCSKEDKYDNDKALKIATSRASSCWGEKGIRLAHSVLTDFTKFYERCERYYKGSEFPEIMTVKTQRGLEYYGIKHRESISSMWLIDNN